MEQFDEKQPTWNMANSYQSAQTKMQIQCQYNIFEDRILLVIATGENAQGWWITRRAAKILLQAIINQITSLTANNLDAITKELLYAFKQEEVAERIPITNEPLLNIIGQDLLTSIRYGSLQENINILVFIGSSGKEQALEVDTDSLISLLGLLRSQISQTDWEISIDWPSSALLDDHIVPNIQ